MSQENPLARNTENLASSSEHSLFINAPIGIINTTPEGRLLSANPAMARMFGYDSPDELIESVNGITTHLYADPSDREELRRLLLENGEVINYECRGVCRDGNIIWTSLNVSTIRDKNGKAINFQSFITDITERKRMEHSLRRERNLSQRYLDTTQTMMVALDSEGRITMINRSGRELLGYAENEILGCNWFETCLPQPEGKYNVYPVFQRIMAGNLESSEYFENSIVCKDGTQRLMGWHNAFLEDDQGRVIGILSSGEDITERKQAEDELFETKQRFDFALRATNTGLWDWNVQTGEVVFNEQWAAMVGYTLDELKPLSIQTWINLCHPEDLKESNALLEKHFKGESEIYKCEARMKHKNGNWIWILDSGKVIEWDEYGRPLRIIGTHTDITERKQIEEELYYLAITDILTDLWNHRYILQAVQRELEKAHRYDNYFFSLLMLDVDHFKEINDLHGHDAGDKVLSYVGDIIKSELRQVDIAGRYGGEEFVMILPQTDKNGANITAERLRKSFYNNPFNYNYKNIYFTVSIGVAEYHQSIISAEEIIKIADNALYEAKDKGRNFTVAVSRDRSQINSFY